MDDIEERAKALIAEYGDLTTGGEAQIQEFKQACKTSSTTAPACRSSGAKHY
jgi:hypothetical protein